MRPSRVMSFFKDMIVQLVIIGINLPRYKLISNASVIVRAEITPHRVPSADTK